MTSAAGGEEEGSPLVADDVMGSHEHYIRRVAELEEGGRGKGEGQKIEMCADVIYV